MKTLFLIGRVAIVEVAADFGRSSSRGGLSVDLLDLKSCAATLRTRARFTSTENRRADKVPPPEQLIAFLGLDVRIRQSGCWQGRCNLTKKGDAEVRRQLSNAAMQGRRSTQWAPYYLKLRERGLSSTAAFVALSRKLAKVSFALLRTNAKFVPALTERACIAT